MKSNLPKEKLNPHKLSFLHNDPNKSYIMKPPMKNLKAFIVPHAGLIYSGDIANEGYAYMDWLKYNRIVILSTHHDSGTFIPISALNWASEELRDLIVSPELQELITIVN